MAAMGAYSHSRSFASETRCIRSCTLLAASISYHRLAAATAASRAAIMVGSSLQPSLRFFLLGALQSGSQ